MKGLSIKKVKNPCSRGMEIPFSHRDLAEIMGVKPHKLKELNKYKDLNI